MTIHYRDLLEVISELLKEKHVSATIRESAKGAAYCGLCTFLGGLLLGPAGVAIGGVAGSVVAYGATKDTLRSLRDVIVNDLSERQKKELANRVMGAVEDFHPTDLVMLITLLNSNLGVKRMVTEAVFNFISSELHVKVID